MTKPLMFGAMLLLPSPLPAQTAQPPAPPATAGDGVVVTARPLATDREVREQIVGVTGHPRSDMPLMRFREPVCIGTAGLPVAAGEAILRRMMETVRSLNMPIAADGCRPNILVLFADDPQEQLLGLRTRSPEIFGDLSRAAVGRIVKGAGPVYAWNAAVRVSRDGDQLFQTDTWPQMKLGAASRLLTPIRQDIAASVIVIQRKALLNKTLGQIADYAVMRGMAATKPVEGMTSATILTLFDKDGGTAPAELTAFDRGVLNGIYASPPHAQATQQVATMERAVREQGGTR
ncbi:hypothetical protein [Sphingomonas sp.]|uniref:hypothetical protein n=1 Tax=Sphingomonas sp. TaxID=28214 RepID=UPI0031DD173B